MNKKIIGFAAVPVLITLFASIFASPYPDALERVAINFGFDEKAKETSSVFTDYAFPFISNEIVSTFFAGIAGMILLYLLYKAAGFAVSKLAR
ncbi:MAG: PDGLE domain-containing protein [Endomicrobium sp.]|jgi:cobalt/nickel transport protein|nr:PDGLE domain-containing protein [Endomicrobium sp.]